MDAWFSRVRARVRVRVRVRVEVRVRVGGRVRVRARARVGRLRHAARRVHPAMGQQRVLGRGAEGLHAREAHRVPLASRDAARPDLA